MDSAGRNKRALIALAGFLVVLLALALFYLLKSGVAHPISALMKAPPTPLAFGQEIQANNGWEYKFDIPASVVPGMLVGNWTSKGKALGLKGAMDDSLVFFKLQGPNNEVLQHLDHPVEGNFSYHVTAPGRYTFLFDNRGIVRSSPRKVALSGNYQPD